MPHHTYLRCPRGCEPVAVYQSSVEAEPVDAEGRATAAASRAHTHWVYYCVTCGFRAYPLLRATYNDDIEVAMTEHWAEQCRRREMLRARNVVQGLCP